MSGQSEFQSELENRSLRGSVERYLKRYLRRAPAALALWRAIEARHFGSVELRRPLLDVGAGFGEFGRAFFDEPCDVGLDISRRDLEVCKDSGAYRMVVQGDARHLPFPDAVFNSVMSVSVLEHIPGIPRFFPEAHRVLKSGGMLVFSVPLWDMDTYMAIPPLARKIGLGFAADAYVKRVHKAFKHFNLQEPAFWLAMVSAAGFEIIEQKRIISRAATRAFDIGLPTAMLSQTGRLTHGRRSVWHPEPVVSAWAKLLLGTAAKEEAPGDGSNLFVVARR